MDRVLFVVLMAMLFTFSAAGPALAQIDIRPQPGGKRLLCLEQDGSVRRSPGGPRVLFIDGDDLRDEPGGKRLLFVDGDDVRPAPGGVRLATIDGGDVRRSVAGKILINYHHPDLCPTAHDKREFFVDGDELTHPQLVAVLYLLKPEMFKISAEETERLEKEMKENGAAEDARIAADRAPGKFMILAANGRDGISSGNVIVGPRAGGAYQMKFEHAKSPEWQGVAVQHEVYSDRYLFAAFGPPKSVALGVYEIKDGTLEGTWYPWYYDGNAKNTGVESLKGPATLDGEFTIVSAKAPNTGAAYTGTVTIKPAVIVGALDKEQPYNLTWTFGEVKVTGIGIRVKDKSKDRLYVCTSGTGGDCFIGGFELNTNSGMSGDWFSGKNEMGMYSTTKME